MWRILSSKQGLTLVELIVVMSIIGMIALFGAPEIMRFVSDSKARSCSTDLIQNMKIAKSMALKENRPYLITFDTSGKKYRIGFDGSSPSDGDLLDSVDGFGTNVNGFGNHGPVRLVDIRTQCGSAVDYGTLAPDSSLPGR